MEKANKTTGRNGALDAYKLFLAVTIAVLHTRYAAKLGYLAVESFFIINGLMFSKYACEGKEFNWKLQVVRRLKAVWVPYALISTLGTAMEFLFWKNKMFLVQYLPQLLLMLAFNRGGTPRSLSPLWYVPVYLLMFLIFSLLLSRSGKDLLDGAAILFAAFSFLAIVAKSESGGWNYTWEPGLFGVVPIGVLRGFMGYSLGYCLGRASGTNLVQQLMKKRVWVTLLQATALVICIGIMYTAPIDYVYDAPYLVASLLLIGTLWAQTGVVYHILSKVPVYLTKHSESVYFCHSFVLAIFFKVMGDYPQSGFELLLYLIVVVAVAVVFQEITGRLQQMTVTAQ